MCLHVCFALLRWAIGSKTRPTLSSSEKWNQNQSWLACPCSPSLRVSHYMYLLGDLSHDSPCYLPPLLLTIVITLIYVLGYSNKNPAIQHFEWIGHVRYVKILTWLWGFQDKRLHLVLFSLFPRDMLEYWCIKQGLLFIFLDMFCAFRFFSHLLLPLVTGPVYSRFIFRTCCGLHLRGFNEARTEPRATVLWWRSNERGVVWLHARSLLDWRTERETDCVPDSPKWQWMWSCREEKDEEWSNVSGEICSWSSGLGCSKAG